MNTRILNASIVSRSGRRPRATTSGVHMLSDKSCPCHRGHPAAGRLPDRRDHAQVLRPALRRPPRTAGRPVQPLQPALRQPAAGPGRKHRRLRHPPGQQPGHPPGDRAVPDRAQARLPGHHRTAVPGGLRAPVRRHRRGPGRGHHPGNRRGLDRGLLAHGGRPDQAREGPLRRPGQRQDVDAVAGRRQDRRPAPAP